MAINTKDLPSWADRAAAALTDIVDDAQQAHDGGHGSDQCKDIRILLAEYRSIKSGHPLWQAKLSNQPNAAIAAELNL